MFVSYPHTTDTILRMRAMILFTTSPPPPPPSKSALKKALPRTSTRSTYDAQPKPNHTLRKQLKPTSSIVLLVVFFLQSSNEIENINASKNCLISAYISWQIKSNIVSSSLTSFTSLVLRQKSPGDLERRFRWMSFMGERDRRLSRSWERPRERCSSRGILLLAQQYFGGQLTLNLDNLLT